MSTRFEDQVRNALDNYELPYDPGSWKKIEKQLAASGTGSSNSARWVAAIAATIVTAVSTVLVYDHYFDIPKAHLAFGANRVQHVEYLNTENKNASITTDILDEKAISENSDNAAANESLHSSNATIESNKSSDANDQDHTNPIGLTVSDEAEFSTKGQNQKTIKGTAKSDGSNVPSNANTVAFKTNVRKACTGFEIDFQLTNGPTEGSYLWNFGDGSFSSQVNPKHHYSNPGVYDVSLSITGKDGLIRSTSMEDLVTINPTPEADFEWDFINGATDEPSVKFINLSENASNSEWRFDGSETDGEISPVKSYINKGKHSVELYVANEFGCSDVTIRYLTINSDYNLLAPAAFSPNSDGVEDTFMPEALRNNNFNFKMTIYDGTQPIYQTAGKNKPWDGKIKNGSLAQTGTSYPWVVIIYNDITKEEKYFSGSVTIIP